MTVFGIRTVEFIGGSTEHYIGEDAALWDWLQEDNYELTPAGWLRVKAPVGYVFHQGNLFPAEHYGGGKDSEAVTASSPKYDKAIMMLVSLRSVSPKEFYELSLEDDRIMDLILE